MCDVGRVPVRLKRRPSAEAPRRRAFTRTTVTLSRQYCTVSTLALPSVCRSVMPQMTLLVSQHSLGW